MRIGFEAKRAFFNRSGLGNYARNILNGISLYHPEIEQIIFTPSLQSGLYVPSENSKVVTPGGGYRFFPGLWRRSGMTSNIRTIKPDLFHGLSHELPLGIAKAGTFSVVTIHDLIFLRYPDFYRYPDRIIYRKKFRQSCRDADHIIAISQQTKNDIIRFFGTDEASISVIYQACDPVFFQPVTGESKIALQQKYNLPEQFILCVGTIEKRKNLLTLLKAVHQHQIRIPLVVAGRQTGYYDQCMEFIRQKGMEKQVRFLHQLSFTDLPVLYSMAMLSVYPSFFEGFGLPVLESLAAGCPVITSGVSSMPEAGGTAALYCNPSDPEEMGIRILSVLEDETLRNGMVQKGIDHAANFSHQEVTNQMVAFYRNMIQQR